MAKCIKCGKNVFFFWQLSKDGLCASCKQMQKISVALRNSLADPQQNARFERGLYAKTTPISLDFERRTGEFAGSEGPYRTTLNRCSCPDFIKRQFPCKHMYRLAVEIGLFDDMVNREMLNQSALSMEDRVPFEDVVLEVDTLLYPAQSKLWYILYLYLYKNKTRGIVSPKNDEIFIELLSKKFVYNSENSSEILESLKRNQLVDCLRKAGITGFKANASKQALSSWCLENVSSLDSILNDYAFCILPSPRYMQYSRRLYSHLKEIVEDSCYVDPDTGEIIESHYRQSPMNID